MERIERQDALIEDLTSRLNGGVVDEVPKLVHSKSLRYRYSHNSKNKEEF